MRHPVDSRTTAGADANAHATASSVRSGPRVAVDQEEHDFGKSDVGVTGRHTFIFTNTGDEPLVLTRGKSTCGCCTCVCTMRLPAGAVAPGQSANVTLEWKSKLYVGPFRQTATIVTNDAGRREVTLSISGRFAGPVGVVPSQLVFDSVRSGQAATSERPPIQLLGGVAGDYRLRFVQSARTADTSTWPGSVFRPSNCAKRERLGAVISCTSP